MAGLKEMCTSTVDPIGHATQLILTLQRIQMDASQLKAAAESGYYSIEEIHQLKRDIQKDLEMVNARLVFACNDLENASRGIPMPTVDEQDDPFGEE